MARDKSVVATPPGFIIREQLNARGMTQKEFSARMDMSQKHISRLINGEVQLTPECAVRLEFVLGTPAKHWNHLEAVYREKLIKAEAERTMDEDIDIAYKLPYGEMVGFGWIPAKRSPKDRVNVLRKFFEVIELSLLENTQITKIACKKLSTSKPNDLALMAWVQQGKILARDMELEPVNVTKISEELEQIRKMTVATPDEAIPKLKALLARCGIAFVMLPNFKDMFFQGATFTDGNKIVLALAEHDNDADNFWFGLFHELGHIVLGHLGYTDGITVQDEKQADRWAREHYI